MNIARVIIGKAVIQEILSKNLVKQCSRVGDILYAELEELSRKYPKHVKNLRGKGQGTYIAFDTIDLAAFVKAMKMKAINIGTCGVDTVRLRPMLIFEGQHVPLFISALDQVLASLH